MKPEIRRNLTITFGSVQGVLRDYIVGSMEEIRNVTLWTVKDLTMSELDWKFLGQWNSIGALLEHIDSSENFFRIRYLERRALTKSEIRRYGPGLPPFAGSSPLFRGKECSYYFEKLIRTRKITMKRILTLTDRELIEPFEGSKANANLAYAFFHFFEDELQHKGQMVMIKKTFNLRENYSLKTIAT